MKITYHNFNVKQGNSFFLERKKKIEYFKTGKKRKKFSTWKYKHENYSWLFLLFRYFISKVFLILHEKTNHRVAGQFLLRYFITKVTYFTTKVIYFRRKVCNFISKVIILPLKLIIIHLISVIL